MSPRRVLIAPLNWGLGHATRCIPLIQHILALGHEPILASDGLSGHVLRKAFPQLSFLALPSYNIQYPIKWRALYWWKKAKDLEKVFSNEHGVIRNYIDANPVDLIISDNRYGVYYEHIPSVIITHQLTFPFPVGIREIVCRKVDQWIAPFDQCWIPDIPGPNNLSGMLSSRSIKVPVTFIGPMSRFVALDVKKEYDLAVVLSGPEPYRQILLNDLLQVLGKSDRKMVWILGDPNTKLPPIGDSEVYSYLGGRALNEMLCASDIVLSRSGYSSIMDYYRLNRKAVLVPTPGQPEQAYLAKRHGKRPEFATVGNRLIGLLEQLEHLAPLSPALPELYANETKIIALQEWL
ncbi:MAG: glycosyltransferase [Saprospiraceae bacterium]|nr:glycosyltransferase [Saprospiraceae bacterium]